MIIMKNDRADNNNNDRDVVDRGWRSTNIHSLKPQDSALRQVSSPRLILHIKKQIKKKKSPSEFLKIVTAFLIPAVNSISTRHPFWFFFLNTWKTDMLTLHMP